MELAETDLSMPILEERRRLLMANNAAANQEARRCIKTALVELMKPEPYEEISIRHPHIRRVADGRL